MMDEVRKTTVLALILGLIIGIVIGFSSSRVIDDGGAGGDNQSDEKTPDYILRKVYLKDRVAAYQGIIDSVKSSAEITENQKPENVAKSVRNWLEESSSCKEYSTLTFSVLANLGYDNLVLSWGYVKLGENNRRSHLWLTWENQSLDYPSVRVLEHVSENDFSKNEVWQPAG